MEDDGQIEYLDEDEDLVQQYVLPALIPAEPVFETEPVAYGEFSDDDIEKKIAQLLVERKPVERKRAISNPDDGDSDYDPAEDLQPVRKKKKVTPKKTPEICTNQKHRTITLVPQQSVKRKLLKAKKRTTSKFIVRKRSSVSEPAHESPVLQKKYMEDRKKLDIRIPNFADAICLPVRAIKNDEKDLSRLQNWNTLCLERYKRAQVVLRPESGKSKCSSRSIVLRNVPNRSDPNRLDTVVWSKTNVENEKGDRKSEVFQCVLPRFREKFTVRPYRLALADQRPIRHSYEVIIGKEEYNNEESLVIYNPKEAVSAVYRPLGKKNCDTSEDEDDDNSKLSATTLREVTCAQVCAPCYQVSWRGGPKVDSAEKKIPCQLCGLSFVSVYNLLTHLRAHHAPRDVRARRTRLASTLADVVPYHYKCRICMEQFRSIKDLRTHVRKHRAKTVFLCEVGNHLSK